MLQHEPQERTMLLRFLAKPRLVEGDCHIMWATFKKSIPFVLGRHVLTRGDPTVDSRTRKHDNE